MRKVVTRKCAQVTILRGTVRRPLAPAMRIYDRFLTKKAIHLLHFSVEVATGRAATFRIYANEIR